MNYPFYTDYPILQLGDESGKEAPIRKVQLVNYDGDKYVTVALAVPEGIILQTIKSGYIYPKPIRYGEGESINTSMLFCAKCGEPFELLEKRYYSNYTDHVELYHGSCR
jgi:hypothetical protein